MSFRRTFLTLALLSAGASAGPAAAPLVFRNTRVFDGTRVIPQADVLVRDGRIEALGPHIAGPEGAQVKGRARDKLRIGRTCSRPAC
jgi:hypothetical protein